MQRVVQIKQPDFGGVRPPGVAGPVQDLSATQWRHGLMGNHGAHTLICQDFEQQAVGYPAVNDVN